MKHATIGFFLAGLVLAGTSADLKAGGKDEGFKKLFNGKDLNGWEIFLNPKTKDADPAKIFSVKDGEIYCEGSVFGYLITKKEYSDYVLKVEWKWGPKGPPKGKRNSGVFVHVTGENKIWPKAIEAQLMEGHAGDFWLVDNFKLSVDPERQDKKTPRHYYRMAKDNIENDIGEWNKYVITCKGDTIKLEINGQVVNQGTGAELTKGKILLQSEGAEIYFRNVMLKSFAKADDKKDEKKETKTDTKTDTKKETKTDTKTDTKKETKKDDKDTKKEESGTLIIEVQDPDILLSIRQGGVTLHKKVKDRTFKLPAGDGMIDLYESALPKPVATEKFTVKAGGKTILKIKLGAVVTKKEDKKEDKKDDKKVDTKDKKVDTKDKKDDKKVDTKEKKVVPFQSMDDYYALADKAFKDRKPMVVFVGGMKRPDLEKELTGYLQIWVEKFPEVGKTGIVVAVPNPRWLTRYDFPANANVLDIRQVLPRPGMPRKN